MNCKSKFYQAYRLFLLCRINNFSIVRSISYIIHKFLYSFFRLNEIESYLKYIEYSSYGYYTPDLVETEMQDTENPLTSPQYNASVKKFIWFTPNCSNVWGGGHYTIFRFANYFANKHDVLNIIFIYDYKPTQSTQIKDFENNLKKALPNCRLKIETDFASLPCCDAAIATTWQSAYLVRNFKLSQKKFYFMQDYESLFYQAGTISLQANYTYSFGFYGITGGLWLKNIYESYGFEAQNYIFSTDKDIFYPKKNLLTFNKVKRIFFYGRPSTERRAYELGISALSLIANAFPHLEIVIAGLDELAKPKFKCKLLGNLSLKDTGSLYRTCDVGIALSATNLSYLPVELMASGCPVITNSGPQVEWYCKDQYNCLVANPTPYSIFKCVEMLIYSKTLRKKLVTNGIKTANNTTWEKEMEKIYQYISSKTKRT